MVSCNDLLNLKIFKNIKLVAGHKGIYKNVSWPYICQTLDFSEWINGGELMFLTGMNMELSNEKIVNLIHQCVSKDISGLVILTNSEYISKVDENIIKKADELSLPLFEMPWNIKLIDVTKEIANYIMELNYKQNKEKELFIELLYSQNLDKEKISNLIKHSNFKLDRHVFVANFILQERIIEKDINMEYILNILKSMLSKTCIKNMLDIQENNIVCIVQLDKKEDFDEQKKILLDVNEQLSKYIDLTLSIGNMYENIYKVRESYIESNKSYKLYKYNDWDAKIIDYTNLGFYKVLFEVNNYEKLKNYTYEQLGGIIECDKSLELLKTLRFYLKNNCNLINTSKEMFIHRNTLIYRLNKIKDILNNNLEDQILKNELMNALMIYDYLKSLDIEQ